MPNVLQHPDWMIGLDRHNIIPPHIPAPLPVSLAGTPAMHPVVARLKVGPWGAVTGRFAADVLCDGNITMARGTDIGPLVPHVVAFSPAFLHLGLVIYTLTSGSKSEFGSSTVLLEQGPVAVAVAWVVNLNLNCLPGVGVVPAPSTVVAGFSFGDFLGGLIATGIDFAVTWGVAKVTGMGAGRMFPAASPFVQELAGAGMGLVLGTPLGPSLSNLLPVVSPVGDYVGKVSDAFGNNEVFPAIKNWATNTARDALDTYYRNPMIPTYP